MRNIVNSDTHGWLSFECDRVMVSLLGSCWACLPIIERVGLGTLVL